MSNKMASFVLPLGATVNMDGTALYQGVAVMFIAQVFGIELSVVQQLTVVFTATLASIGAAGVPSAGIITLTIVLRQAGVPDTGLALILGVDRILAGGRALRRDESRPPEGGARDARALRR